MRTHSADALVLRTYRYGEADCIVVFLTADRGKRRGVAKNAAKSRRRFGAALGPLTWGLATYVEREHRELVRLERIEPRLTPLGAAAGREDGDAARALGYAAYFAELLDEWAPEAAPNERLYRLGAALSQALHAGGSPDALARYFEYWLLRLEGIYPAIDVCPRCSASLTSGAVLAAAERAYVCRACAHGGPDLSEAAIAFLRQAATRPPGAMATRRTSAGVLCEIEQVHARLIAIYLEKELRSARVVRELRAQL